MIRVCNLPSIIAFRFELGGFIHAKTEQEHIGRADRLGNFYVGAVSRAERDGSIECQPREIC